ncbi:MAG: 6-phosphogluconolactonase [Pseudomonadota bacterium]
MSAPMRVAECRYPTAARLVADLADLVAANLSRTLQGGADASLVVSGGSTPAPLFDALSAVELDWSRVTVSLADERWVPADHADSNEALVRSRLLVGKAADASFVSLYEAGMRPVEAQARVAARVAAMPLPFDAVLLGMGTDGHTASFFPGDAMLEEVLSPQAGLCMGMMPPSDPRGRMTMSLRMLVKSRRIVLHITGEEKWRLYREISQAAPDAASTWPVKAVLLQDKAPVSVFWNP